MYIFINHSLPNAKTVQLHLVHQHIYLHFQGREAVWVTEACQFIFWQEQVVKFLHSNILSQAPTYLLVLPRAYFLASWAKLFDELSQAEELDKLKTEPNVY